MVFSHGWSDLAPFRVLSSNGEIETTLHGKGLPVSVCLEPIPNGCRVRSTKKLSKQNILDVRWMFRLDCDLSDFYRLAKNNHRKWIVERKMGRLLRSQTVFEDLIKLILTTNCNWQFTRLMVENLMKLVGNNGLFPTPEALAKKTEAFYRTKIRSGYRSPHLRSIGKMIVSGKLNPESWRNSPLPTAELRKEILKVPGAGPYVADNLLKFLGRNEFLGLDSWARAKLKQEWRLKKAPSDKEISRTYEIFGAYKGLMLWCDLTKDWLESDEFDSWIRTDEVL